MESLLIGALLIVVGLLSASLGYVLFRLILPILGFIAGFSIAFGGVVGVFGANVVSYFAAITAALLFGVIFALLSYTYYTVAVIVLGATLGAGFFAMLGQAIGLQEEGFIAFMLSVTGAILGGLLVARYGLQHSLIVYLTSLYGVGLILLGVFVIVGDQSLESMRQSGVTNAIGDVVSQSWVWLMAWLGGGIMAAYTQMAVLARAAYNTAYVIQEA